MLNHRNRDVTKKEQGGLAKAEVAGRRFQPKRRAQGQIGQRRTDSAQDEGSMVDRVDSFRPVSLAKDPGMLENGQREHLAGQR